MALSVTGTDANGRVTTGTAVSVSAGRLIPPENAGVGDIVYCKQNADPKELEQIEEPSGSGIKRYRPKNLKIIGWGTVSNSNNITIGSSNDTYVCYGVIYGFVNGMARIAALSETGLRWAMYGPGTDTTAPTTSGGDGTNPTVSRTTAIATGGLMRNGKTATYAGMNLSSLMQNSYAGTVSSNLLHPSAAWDTSVMWSKSVFENTTTYPDASYTYLAEARQIYGTWENYVRQTMAVQGAPGTVFGFHDSGVKIHEQGRYNTSLLGIYGPVSGAYASTYPGDSLDNNIWYPAANYCYNYAVSGVSESGKHNWWLPSMHELYDLMTDEHWRKVNTCGTTTLNNRADRWSSVRYGSSYAWYFSGYGFSYNSYFRSAFTSRPVSLLQIV